MGLKELTVAYHQAMLNLHMAANGTGNEMDVKPTNPPVPAKEIPKPDPSKKK